MGNGLTSCLGQPLRRIWLGSQTTARLILFGQQCIERRLFGGLANDVDHCATYPRVAVLMETTSPTRGFRWTTSMLICINGGDLNELQARPVALVVVL